MPEERTRAYISRPLRILCAEDHPTVGEALMRMLVIAGHVPERAVDGLVAWQKMSQDICHFDLLITDHQMPRVNGLGLVQRLRGADYPGKIIVHSNALREAEMASYQALSVDLVLLKAPGLEGVLAAIDALCWRATIRTRRGDKQKPAVKTGVIEASPV